MRGAPSLKTLLTMRIELCSESSRCGVRTGIRFNGLDRRRCDRERARRGTMVVRTTSLNSQDTMSYSLLFFVRGFGQNTAKSESRCSALTSFMQDNVSAIKHLRRCTNPSLNTCAVYHFHLISHC